MPVSVFFLEVAESRCVQLVLKLWDLEEIHMRARGGHGFSPAVKRHGKDAKLVFEFYRRFPLGTGRMPQG